MSGVVVAWAVWISLALGAGLAAVAALVTATSVRGHVLKTPTTVILLWTVGIGVLVGTALSGRTFDLAVGMGVGDAEARSSASWVGRVLSLGSVTLALALVLQAFVNPKRIELPRSAITIGYVSFVLLSMITGSIMGTRPAFIHNLFYAPLLLIALSLDREISLSQFVTHAKYVLLVVVAASLAAGLALPKLATEPGYHGFIPGIAFRLHGLVGHANVLGPVALTYLLLELWVPARWYVRIPAVVMASIALLLAQSKTTWIACVAVGGLLMVRALWPRRDEASQPTPGTVLAVAGLVLCVALVVCSVWYGIYAIEAGELGRFIGSDRLQELSSFTGRTRIWEITWSVWEENPWFGYGPTLWSPQMRLEYRLFVAGQAHNQYLQTLGDSGMVGLLGLGGYLLAMIWAGVKGAQRSRGISICLVVILLLRAMTEAPLRNAYIMDAGFLLHMIVFGVLLMSTREPPLVPSASSQTRG